jgi:3-oxocholest-4-en-26-oyl-CoA dehydrogenase alpha subunit
VDFRLTDNEKRWQSEVRSFLKENLPHDWAYTRDSITNRDESWAISREFVRMVGKKGWLGLGWPKEYGGQARPYMDQFLFQDEMSYQAAPTDNYNIGTGIVGPSLMVFGSDEQKKQFLPGIIAGDLWFCVGYSEPSAGSDLASLQTQAVADGDDFIINGQKIWTTNAHRADYCWLAVRTDPEAAKHKGISLFLVDMKTPGITVRPILNMLDVHSFNQVFFDDVRVHKSCLVGELNRGWYQIAAALDYERSPTFIAVSPLRRALDELVEMAKQSGPLAPGLRTNLAQLAVDVKVHELLAYRLVWMIGQHLIPNHEASISKLFGSELRQRIANSAFRLLTLYGQLKPDSKRAAFMGRFERSYLSSVAGTIGAGASEVQRNIIATRGLGLPRS